MLKFAKIKHELLIPGAVKLYGKTTRAGHDFEVILRSVGRSYVALGGAETKARRENLTEMIIQLN